MRYRTTGCYGIEVSYISSHSLYIFIHQMESLGIPSAAWKGLMVSDLSHSLLQFIPPDIPIYSLHVLQSSS